MVVITGEALKKENAEQMAKMLARWSGRFNCVSAGPNHEALMAACGSGAVEVSRRGRSTVLNLDIGGGTTKVSLIANGVVLNTEALRPALRAGRASKMTHHDWSRSAFPEAPSRSGAVGARWRLAR